VNTVRQESHRVRSLGLRLATLLLLGGLGWGLFGPFLSLPYLFDDPVVLRAARDARWAEIWTSLRWPVGYYRPLGLTLWKAADLLWREGAVFAWLLIPAFGSLPGSMECSLWPPWRSGFPLLGPERRCEAYRLRIGDGTRFISFKD